MAAAPPVALPITLIRRRRAQAIRDARTLYKESPGSLIVIPSKGHDTCSGRQSPAWGRHMTVIYALGLLARRDEKGQRQSVLAYRELTEGGSSTRALARWLGRSHDSVWRALDDAWAWMCDPEQGRVLTPDAWRRGIEEETAD